MRRMTLRKERAKEELIGWGGTGTKAELTRPEEGKRIERRRSTMKHGGIGTHKTTE